MNFLFVHRTLSILRVSCMKREILQCLVGFMTFSKKFVSLSP